MGLTQDEKDELDLYIYRDQAKRHAEDVVSSPALTRIKQIDQRGAELTITELREKKFKRYESLADIPQGGVVLELAETDLVAKQFIKENNMGGPEGGMTEKGKTLLARNLQDIDNHLCEVLGRLEVLTGQIPDDTKKAISGDPAAKPHSTIEAASHMLNCITNKAIKIGRSLDVLESFI
jgi:hypothetical protein